MRIAIVSDIHGNLTALEAVITDLRRAAPDLILHGGDLPHGGARPAEIVDRIRELGWQGVVGNTNEMLFNPDSLKQFAANQSAQLQPLFAAIEEMAAADREALGEERLAWLRDLPCIQSHGPMALVHASPDTTWRAPGPEASDTELESVYAPLGQPVSIYAHVHRSYTRRLSGGAAGRMTVANTGSVSLSYDGDRRAAYLLLDNSTPAIRRVEYDVDREVKALSGSRLPHSGWIAKMLLSASPQMP
jgi:predicted phosphodiesterase